MPSLTLPTPTPDELDDLIYFSRAGELDSLKELISQLCTTHTCPPSVLIASAIDIDADGLGSQSCLLHYPAANGNIEIITYLLSLLTPSPMSGSQGTTADKSAPEMVNHKNINGNTPLHWAGMNGHIEVVKALVGAGADPTVRNEAGRDVVVESENSKDSGVKGAEECVVWLLRNCEGLEKGIGAGAGEGEGEPVGDGDDDEEEVVMTAGEVPGSHAATEDKKENDGTGNGDTNGA